MGRRQASHVTCASGGSPHSPRSSDGGVQVDGKRYDPLRRQPDDHVPPAKRRSRHSGTRIDIVPRWCYFSNMVLENQRPLRLAELGKLSRRERQVLDILYRDGKLSASGIRLRMEDAPTDSAVRAVLRVLEEKGLLRHRTAGFRYVYSPVVDRNRATRSVLQYLINTFFGGSPERAVAALLDVSAAELDSGELEKISDLIERARRGKA